MIQQPGWPPSEAVIQDLEWRRFVEQAEARHAQEQSGVKIRRSAWPFHIAAACQRALEQPNTRIGVHEAIANDDATILSMYHRLPDDLSALMLDVCPPEHPMHPTLHNWYDTTVQGIGAQWQMFSPEAQRTVVARMKAPIHVLIVVGAQACQWTEAAIEKRLGVRIAAIVGHVFKIPSEAKMEIVAVTGMACNAWRIVISEASE